MVPSPTLQECGGKNLTIYSSIWQKSAASPQKLIKSHLQVQVYCVCLFLHFYTHVGISAGASAARICRACWICSRASVALGFNMADSSSGLCIYKNASLTTKNKDSNDKNKHWSLSGDCVAFTIEDQCPQTK